MQPALSRTPQGCLAHLVPTRASSACGASCTQAAQVTPSGRPVDPGLEHGTEALPFLSPAWPSPSHHGMLRQPAQPLCRPDLLPEAQEREHSGIFWKTDILATDIPFLGALVWKSCPSV